MHVILRNDSSHAKCKKPPTTQKFASVLIAIKSFQLVHFKVEVVSRKCSYSCKRKNPAPSYKIAHLVIGNKVHLCMAGGIAQVLSTVCYFYCKCDWTQREKKKREKKAHAFITACERHLAAINQLLHIFLQSTVNLSQPKKTPQENIHKKRITSLKDTSFLLHPFFSLARTLARLGVKMGGRGGKRERHFFLFCRQELLKATNLFQCSQIYLLLFYIQHFCNLGTRFSLKTLPSSWMVR